MAADAPSEKVYRYEDYRNNPVLHNNVEEYGFKSTLLSSKHSSFTNAWQIKKATWIKPQQDTHITQYNNLLINNDISLKIPTGNKELEKVFLEGKYILDLKDNWDDEGALGYTQESWKSAANFVINFNRWLRGIFSGSLHLPKIHHGPKGTIDIVWSEDNFRLFVNIDYENNKGTFYSDTPKKQYSEGEFLLNDFKFHLLPLPFKY